MITKLGEGLLSCDESSKIKILGQQALKVPAIQGVLVMLIGSDGFAYKKESRHSGIESEGVCYESSFRRASW